MGRIVQRVDPDELGRALAPHARAAIAWDRDGAVETIPALYRRDGDEHCVGVARDLAPTDGACERAVLVLDDGSWWFELRAVTLRGRIEPGAGAADGDLVWLRFVPVGAIAWDYGTLHESDAT